MDLISLFEKTLNSLKKSTKIFLFVCFIFAMLTTMPKVFNLNFSVQDVQDNVYLDDNSVDNDYSDDIDADLLNDILSSDEDFIDDSALDLSKVFSDMNISSSLLKLIPFAIISVIVLICIMVIVTTIINYYFIGLAIESINECKIHKGKNMLNVILAGLTFVLIVSIPLLAGLLGIIFGIYLSNVCIAIVSGILGFIVFIWLSIKYCPIYFVAVKYQELSFKEILFKASDMTKNNILNILGYTLLCSFATSIIVGLIESLSVNVLFIPGIGIIIYGALMTVVTTISISFSCLFNVNMFEALDS